MQVFLAVLSGVFGYLIGSVNTSIIVGKCYGVDIRTKGSGNAGATNAVRVLGKLPGILVFLGDFLKGLVACFLGSLLVQDLAVIAGAGAVLGHNFPVYFGFKGGKGIATSFGVLLFMDYRVAVIIGLICVVLIVTTRIVSLSSLIGFFLLPFVTFFVNPGPNFLYVYITAFLTILTFFAHRQNIVRLANGTENRFGSKKEK